MSIEALRKKKRMRRPRPRLTDGQKSAVLLALTFAEGWLVGFAGTHSLIPSPVGTPQWMITGSLALAVVLPLMFVGILLKWGGDRTGRSSRSVCRATRCRRGVPASTTGTR